MAERMSTVVQAIVRQAKEGRKAPQLLAMIRPLIGRDYNDSVVSQWLSGAAMPPADVLLAIAKVTEVSIDELLFGESLTARQDRLEQELGELRRQIDEPQ